MEQIFYFDHAATTKCCDAALKRLSEFTGENFGNPSSTHFLGQASAKAIRQARRFFADTFKVKPSQVIFTSGGTESDNLALYGTLLPKVCCQPSKKVRIIVSAIEHPAIRNTAKSLEDFGVDVQFCPVDATGKVDAEALNDLLTPNTAVVSIMTVNNIVGTLQPIEELAKQVKEKVPNAVFHTDAIQGFGKVGVPAAGSAVDLISISSHKIEGPKGVGALVVLNADLLETGKFRPLFWGGGQENGRRSGTENPGLIAGFHAAAEQTFNSRETFLKHTQKLSDLFRHLLEPLNGEVRWNSPEDAVPYILSFSLPNHSVEEITRHLEKNRCLVATGSACSSGSSAPDPVLKAMGCPDECCTSAIRVSFSLSNTEEDVKFLAKCLRECLS